MDLSYELGEMKSENGAVLRYEVEELASEIAIRLFQFIKDCSTYKEIENKLNSPKVSLYFQKMIKLEIYPVIIKLCVLRWYKRNDLMHKIKDETISVHDEGIFTFLDKVWPSEDFKLRIEKKRLNSFNLFKLRKMYQAVIKKSARTTIDKFHAIYNKLKYPNAFSDCSTKNCIALQYAEGLDLQRRSDLVWFVQSQIDPKRVLIYFEVLENNTGNPILKEVTDSVEKMGMRWVHLRNGIIEKSGMPAWYPPILSDDTFSDLKFRPTSSLEKWVGKIGKSLLKDVKYWFAFYKTFNIKVDFIIGEGIPKYIAKSIAIKQHESEKGILVFKHRSEMFWPAQSLLGHYPADVVFTWATRYRKYYTPNVNRIKSAVTTGYPNDYVFQMKSANANEIRSKLRLSGVSYSVALFDNVCGSIYSISSKLLEKFYLQFLNWILEDPTFGIVIKSKKEHILEELPEVLPVLEKAKATGRCICLGDVNGRLPVDASLATDMAIGIGISTAVIESAIAGCRGIHCDLSCLNSHEFYKWGNEKIIFNDLDKMVNKLKQFKEDKNSCSDLGDWSPFYDKLDPFRDGRAGERMGQYIKWLLDSFDKNGKSEDAIKYATECYRKEWGEDKVMDMEK